MPGQGTDLGLHRGCYYEIRFKSTLMCFLWNDVFSIVRGAGCRLKCCWDCIRGGEKWVRYPFRVLQHRGFPQNTTLLLQTPLQMVNFTLAQFGEREKRQKKRRKRQRICLIHLPMDKLILVLTCDSTDSSYLWVSREGDPQTSEAEGAVS